MGEIFYDIKSTVAGIMLMAVVFILPLILTIINISDVLTNKAADESKGKVSISNWSEMLTIVFGVLFSAIYAELIEIQMNTDWMHSVYNSQLHTPIATWTRPTIITFMLIAICAYLMLRFISTEKLPPLIIALGIACMYIGIVLCALWIMQIFTESAVLLALFPFNCIVLAIKTIQRCIFQWNKKQMRDRTEEKYKGKSLLQKCNRFLAKSETWPKTAFFLMWPIFGIVMIILVLFGQAPDSIIQAWTQTSEWNLSQQSDNHIYFDEHYLCTVAAGGHKEVVKPVRLGVRHGHRVVVNRQLCIANAFEQIIQEKLPRAHKHIRFVYDNYGYPIAKHINSKYIADAVYFLMKPLEWIFLFVIYLCDAKPENRIALQYITQPPKLAVSK